MHKSIPGAFGKISDVQMNLPRPPFFFPTAHLPEVKKKENFHQPQKKRVAGGGYGQRKRGGKGVKYYYCSFFFLEKIFVLHPLI